MKKIVLLSLFVLGFLPANSQGVLSSFNNSDLIRNRVIGKKDASIDGSPYYNEKFVKASVINTEGYITARYNAYNDEFEIKEDSYSQESFLLPKDEKYKTVKVYPGGEEYTLINYTDTGKEAQYGYLINLNPDSKVNVLRRDRIKLMAEKQGNGYTGTVPAKYYKANTEYYIRKADGSVALYPKNKKELLKAFGEKAAQIESFIKTNKTSFKNEKDLIKLSNFLGA